MISAALKEHCGSVVCFSCSCDESDAVQLLAELHCQIGFVLRDMGYF